MKLFYVYDVDGRILRAGHCTDQDFEAQAGKGETLVEGEADPKTQYVKGGELVDMPARPSDFHHFDYALELWVADVDAAWAEARAQRNARLTKTDWTMLPDAPIAAAATADTTVPTVTENPWIAYRQSLRDITEQTDPFNIEWPLEPK